MILECLPRNFLRKPEILSTLHPVKFVRDLDIFEEIFFEMKEKFAGIDDNWKKYESNVVSGLVLLTILTDFDGNLAVN